MINAKDEHYQQILWGYTGYYDFPHIDLYDSKRRIYSIVRHEDKTYLLCTKYTYYKAKTQVHGDIFDGAVGLNENSLIKWKITDSSNGSIKIEKEGMFKDIGLILSDKFNWTLHSTFLRAKKK